MTLILESYPAQLARWPSQGRHILAQYDGSSVIVYQAYRPSIARWALHQGRLGGPDFSFRRMSWIKPNFLWLMYRSGWGTKDGQEVTLALRIRRAFFDSLVTTESSEVRVQWDPDHDPSGAPLQRRALQLGLRGSALAALAAEQLLEIIDASPLVAAQRGLCRGRRMGSSSNAARRSLPAQNDTITFRP